MPPGRERRVAKPHTPIEFFDTYEQAAARFQELRSEPYNSENLSAARLTFGVQRKDPPGAADLLQVRQGKNYLLGRLHPDGIGEPKPRGYEHPEADAEEPGL